MENQGRGKKSIAVRKRIGEKGKGRERYIGVKELTGNRKRA